MTESRKDQLSGLVFLAFSIFMYAVSFSIQTSTADALGPQFFPQIVSIVMGVLSVVLIFGSTRKNLREKAAGSAGTARKPLKWNFPSSSAWQCSSATISCWTRWDLFC